MLSASRPSSAPSVHLCGLSPLTSSSKPTVPGTNRLDSAARLLVEARATGKRAEEDTSLDISTFVKSPSFVHPLNQFTVLRLSESSQTGLLPDQPDSQSSLSPPTSRRIVPLDTELSSPEPTIAGLGALFTIAPRPDLDLSYSRSASPNKPELGRKVSSAWTTPFGASKTQTPPSASTMSPSAYNKTPAASAKTPSATCSAIGTDSKIGETSMNIG